ncbi:hypothetical protein ACTS93_02515 [Empedobacter falsenii]
MAKKFTQKQREFFHSKEVFHVGIAHEYRNGFWSIYGWEYYKRKKISDSKITLVAEDDSSEQLTISRKDLDDGFIKVL